MSIIDKTHIELNLSLNKHAFTTESTTVEIQPVDFDNRETANEVDRDLDQKTTIKIQSHIKSEEEYLETHSQDNFSLKEDHFTAESVTVKRELDDFDNWTTANEVDQDLDQKLTIKSEEEENFINSQYFINQDEVDIKSEDDVEQSDNRFIDHKVGQKPEDQIKVHKCPDCPYRSKHKSNIRQHAVVHNKTGQFGIFKCELCVYATPRKHNLKRHHMVRHGENVPWIHCPEPECRYKTYEKTKLKVHSRVHSDDQLFKCTQCPYQTKHQFHLKTHQLKHESIDKWHACPQCPFKTIRKYSLQLHVRTHAKPEQLEWYMCEQCPYKTKRKYSLKKHVFTHNTDNAKGLLQCTSCSFKTLRKYDFRQHQMKHQDDDDNPGWHKCPECPYKAIYKAPLLKHAINHHAAHQSKWLQCPECSYRTPRRSHLRAHQMLHTAAVEWFRCFDCPYKTNWKRSLVSHVKLHL